MPGDDCTAPAAASSSLMDAILSALDVVDWAGVAFECGRGVGSGGRLAELTGETEDAPVMWGVAKFMSDICPRAFCCWMASIFAEGIRLPSAPSSMPATRAVLPLAMDFRTVSSVVSMFLIDLALCEVRGATRARQLTCACRME